MRFGQLGRAWACLALVALVGAACTNTPPPPEPTATPATPTTPQNAPSQIVVGVDGVAGGYNPHNIADASTVTSALSQLLLPSVFRVDDKGEPKLDETLMSSAKVIEQEPFTVAYEIRPDASWSDGAPIAAEDFSYLADAMRSQPGTVNPAGYHLISDIASRKGGKRVEVTFTERYPGWRSLFDDLLPAHLLKDAPGGWQAALSSSFPAYGGPFSIKVLDKARGEIILERNERYWEKPAAVDQLVLRRSDRTGLLAAVRSGNDQFALTRLDAAGVRAFGALGERTVQHTVVRPEVAEVLLRPVADGLADDDLRSGIAALLDREKLIDTGVAGGPSATLRADAVVLAPSEPGYSSTLPAARLSAAPDRAARLLADAGYDFSEGSWRSELTGEPLSLVIASPGEREPYASIAAELERQLTEAGVDATTIDPPSRELFGTVLANRERAERPTGDHVAVDIVVAPRIMGTDSASSFASRFGCAWPHDDNGEDASRTSMRPVNASGFCAEELESLITDALTGEVSMTEAVRRAEPALWRENVVIPLFQLADTLVLGDGVSGVTPGPPLIGPFGSAVNWIRTSG
ncbi:MAG: ABC transporter family substrate-binding protein [Haloechinothrix sp.]